MLTGSARWKIKTTVLTGMAMRLDGAVAGLGMEMRGLVQAMNRTNQRLRKF